MLGPLLVSAAQQTRAFAAVVLGSGTAAADLRLSTELLLQHNFRVSPSRVQLGLRAYLTDEKPHKVLAWKNFVAEIVATSDTPQGGGGQRECACAATAQAHLPRGGTGTPQTAGMTMQTVKSACGIGSPHIHLGDLVLGGQHQTNGADEDRVGERPAVGQGQLVTPAGHRA